MKVALDQTYFKYFKICVPTVQDSPTEQNRYMTILLTLSQGLSLDALQNCHLKVLISNIHS
jgi:hypothetical protein